MSLMSDRWIREMAVDHKMITPFTDKQIRNGVISYGLSGYGYDIRLGREFKLFTNIKNTVIDPKHFPEDCYCVDWVSDVCEIPPYSFLLGRSLEYLCIPRDVLVICVGKSTYARCGIIINVTPLEPEWEGYITLEIFNASPLPVRLYAGEGVCQCVFLRGIEVCETSYADRKGKYMRQMGVTLPKV